MVRERPETAGLSEAPLAHAPEKPLRMLRELHGPFPNPDLQEPTLKTTPQAMEAYQRRQNASAQDPQKPTQ